MPDEYLGDIIVPPIVASGTFPLVPDYPYGVAQDPQIKVHRLAAGTADGKIEQRFLIGSGVKVFTIKRAELTLDEKDDLVEFWEQQQGAFGAFTYNAPNRDGNGTTPYVVRFKEHQLSLEYLVGGLVSSGVELVEIPTTGITYPTVSEVTRFPGTALEAALLDPIQQLIPLIRIQPRELNYPTIYLSDRRITIGTQEYLPRLLAWDKISQGINGESDQASFTFGDADRVMTALANDTDLYLADIQFSLFHVGQLTKINLWAGNIGGFAGQEGSNEFKVEASDGLYALNISCPRRTVSRMCDKVFNNAANGCPFSTTGQLHTARDLPTGSWTLKDGYQTEHYTFIPDGTKCDKGYLTPNGCAAHEMDDYFHGIQAVVRHLINPFPGTSVSMPTGKIGYLGITKSSQISDTVYGKPIPMIYCDSLDPDKSMGFPVQCLLAEGLEGGRYTGLGIVGEGPLIEYCTPNSKIDTKNNPHKLDGQDFWGWLQDPPRSIDRSFQESGIFLSLGEDPNPDPFGLNTAPNAERAGGTAFAKIARENEAGMSVVDAHTMQIGVRQGLGGYSWAGAAGDYVRSMITPLTNPVWIAINIFLDTVGKKNASDAEQQELFDVEAAIEAAEVCDNVVVPIVPRYYTTYGPAKGHYVFGRWVEDEAPEKIKVPITAEKQFVFQGIIRDQRAVRDWLQEILNACLGYFTWSSGKLRIGIRSNSSTIQAFNAGNILWNSFQYQHTQPAFNHLTLQFADDEYGFQSNTVTFYQMDNAEKIGGGGQARFTQSKIAISGVSNKSQAFRIVTARVWEELGGKTEEMWAVARNLRFKTTVLALATEAGMVCSLDHPDMPDRPASPLGSIVDPQEFREHYGEFRVTKWTLNSDFSIDIEGKTTHNCMYELIDADKPADVDAPPPKRIVKAHTIPWRWSAGYALPNDDSPFPEGTFGLSQGYKAGTDGKPINTLEVVGNPPISNCSRIVPRPVITAAAANIGGGSVIGGKTYSIGLSAYDSVASTGESALSNLISVVVPAGTGYSLTISVEWPIGSYGGRLYVGEVDADHGMHHQSSPHAGSSTSGTENLSLTSYTPQTSGPPDPPLDHMNFRIKRVIHGGIWGTQISAVDHVAKTLQIAIPVASGMGGFETNELAGRYITLYATSEMALGDPIPYATYLVESNNSDTLTLSEDPVDASPLDVVVMRIQLVGGALTWTDPFLANVFSSYSGLLSGAEIGNLAWIIAGTGINQSPRLIVSNDATSFTLSEAWDVEPDSTSIVIIVERPWSSQLKTQPSNAEYFSATGSIASIPVNNYAGESILVQALTENLAAQSLETYAPVREVYIWATQGSRTIYTDDTVRGTDQTILCDTESNNANIVVNLLPSAQMHNQELTIVKQTSDPNTVTVLPAEFETINDQGSFVLTLQWDSVTIKATG